MPRTPPALLALLLVPLASSCTRANASPSASGDDPLVVHEWGTFTGFEGADGGSVEGLQHETEALPAFVHSRLAAKATPLSVYGDPSKDVPIRHCYGKMETPVIYFHTRTPRHVSVHVTYEGLLTQWYPAAARATPVFSGAEQHDLQGVPTSSLDWELDLVPRAGRAPSIPAVPKESDWQKAREVDAAYVRTSATKSEAEQYVFYRGLMRQVPQPRIVPDDANGVTIDNPSGEAIHAAFLLDMTAGEGRFMSLGAVAPGTRAASLAASPYAPKEAVVGEIAAAMTTALEADGLFADEAKAMVRTWSETWFSQTGTRLLYLVPRSVTDKTLPLTITPAPDRVVRVLVGRVEYLTRGKQAEVTRDVITAGTVGPFAASPDDKGAALTRIAMLGRFAEPATRAVAAASTDPRVAAAAPRVLGLVTH